MASASIHIKQQRQQPPQDLHLSTRGERRSSAGKRADETLAATEAVLLDLVQNSSFFDKNTARHIPSFSPEEVLLGKELGRGEFGVVHEVSTLCLDDTCNCDSPLSQGDVFLGSVLPVDRSVSSLPPVESIVIAQTTQHHQPQNPCHERTPSVTFAGDTKDGCDSGNVFSSDTIESTENTASLSAILSDNEKGGGESCGNARSSSMCKPNLQNEKHDAQDDDDDDSARQYHRPDDQAESDEELILLAQNNTRKSMAVHTHRNGTARYAIKRLKRGFKLDAALDLACEAMFLQSINHTNVIHLRGTVGIPGTPGFAILLDRLVQTLDLKMEEWRPLVKVYKGKFMGLVGRRNVELDNLLTIRLLVCFDIARALRHLHKNNILYRDLKPENIGFNVRGDVQIFDFGLAKELKSVDSTPEGYDATGLTGSRRYMAPEVVRCLPYDYKIDVYSFSILFWQICSLQDPFPRMDTNKHFDTVVLKKKRPGKLSQLPIQIHSMMETGWSDDPDQRPSFRQICQILQVSIADRTGTSEANFADRSVHLLDRSLASYSGRE